MKRSRFNAAAADRNEGGSCDRTTEVVVVDDGKQKRLAADYVPIIGEATYTLTDVASRRLPCLTPTNVKQ